MIKHHRETEKDLARVEVEEKKIVAKHHYMPRGKGRTLSTKKATYNNWKLPWRKILIKHTNQWSSADITKKNRNKPKKKKKLQWNVRLKIKIDKKKLEPKKNNKMKEKRTAWQRKERETETK